MAASGQQERVADASADLRTLCPEGWAVLWPDASYSCIPECIHQLLLLAYPPVEHEMAFLKTSTSDSSADAFVLNIAGPARPVNPPVSIFLRHNTASRWCG